MGPRVVYWKYVCQCDELLQSWGVCVSNIRRLVDYSVFTFLDLRVRISKGGFYGKNGGVNDGVMI